MLYVSGLQDLLVGWQQDGSNGSVAYNGSCTDLSLYLYTLTE